MRYSLKTLGFSVTIAALALVVFLQQRKIDSLRRSYNWRSDTALTEEALAAWWQARAVEALKRHEGSEAAASAVEDANRTRRHIAKPPKDLVRPGAWW